MKTKSRAARESTPAHAKKPEDIDRNQPELNIDELTGVVGGANPAVATKLGPDTIAHKHLAGVKYE
jgi:hypothetical protein